MLPAERWLSRGEAIAGSFVAAFGEHTDFERMTAGELHGVATASSGRAAVFGHPLWRSEPENFVEAQRTADSQVRAIRGIKEVRFFDLATLQRHPAKVFAWLQPSPLAS